MSGYTYIPRCADGTFYVGSTRDLRTRLTTHAQGMGSAYTACRLPVTLVWFGVFDRIDEAFGSEKRIQGWSHAKRLAFIEGGIDAVKGWSARERKMHRGRRSDPRALVCGASGASRDVFPPSGRAFPLGVSLLAR
ncbi:GIY-YIG nuclease family protein [Microbacterium soli]